MQKRTHGIQSVRHSTHVESRMYFKVHAQNGGDHLKTTQPRSSSENETTKIISFLIIRHIDDENYDTGGDHDSYGDDNVANEVFDDGNDDEDDGDGDDDDDDDDGDDDDIYDDDDDDANGYDDDI